MKKGGRKSFNNRPVVQKSLVDLVLTTNNLLEDKIIFAGTKPQNSKVELNLYPTKSVTGFSSTKKISISNFENCKKQLSRTRLIKKSLSNNELKPVKSFSTPKSSSSIPKLPEIRKNVQASNTNIDLPVSSRITSKGLQGYKFSTLYTNRSLIKSKIFN